MRHVMIGDGDDTMIVVVAFWEGIDSTWFGQVDGFADVACFKENSPLAQVYLLYLGSL